PNQPRSEEEVKAKRLGECRETVSQLPEQRSRFCNGLSVLWGWNGCVPISNASRMDRSTREERQSYRELGLRNFAVFWAADVFGGRNSRSPCSVGYQEKRRPDERTGAGYRWSGVGLFRANHRSLDYCSDRDSESFAIANGGKRSQRRRVASHLQHGDGY